MPTEPMREATSESTEQKAEHKRQQRPGVVKRLSPIPFGNINAERRCIAGHMRYVDVIEQ